MIVVLQGAVKCADHGNISMTMKNFFKKDSKHSQENFKFGQRQKKSIRNNIRQTNKNLPNNIF